MSQNYDKYVVETYRNDCFFNKGTCSIIYYTSHCSTLSIMQYSTVTVIKIIQCDLNSPSL